MSLTLGCPSELRWDRYDANELSMEERRKMRLHLAACPLCQKRRQVREENLLFLQQQSNWPPRQLVESIGEPVQELAPLEQQDSLFLQRKQEPTPSLWERLSAIRWWWAPALAPLLLLLLWLPDGKVPSEFSKNRSKAHLKKKLHISKQPPVKRAIRKKPKKKPSKILGNPKSKQPWVQMLHYRLGEKRSRWTREGEVLHPGDLVQFEYNVSKPLQLMIVSVNQKGEFSVYAPLGGKRSLKLPGTKGTFPERTSIELDESIGTERLWMLTSTKVLTKESVLRAVMKSYKRAKGDLKNLGELVGHWHSDSILIVKRKRVKTKSAPSLKRTKSSEK